MRHRRYDSGQPEERQRDVDPGDVGAALTAGLETYALRELVPELDWAVLDSGEGERQALLRLAEMAEDRTFPAASFASDLRRRAEAMPVAQLSPRNGRKLLMTMFGWNDIGGGTIVPRLLAKEFVRRGWDVTVFHAATEELPGEPPYALREWVEDGVRLVGVHNRPTKVFDLGNPLRELEEPEIYAAFRRELDQFRPDVVHFHNLHNLGASLIDEAAASGVPAYFTTHNHWLICQRAYLVHGDGSLCPGPADGARCAPCADSPEVADYRRRLTEIRSRVQSGVTRVLAISKAVRRTLISTGYAPESVDVVRQVVPQLIDIWETVGKQRQPGRRNEDLTVAFLGSAYLYKGPQLLVQAAQQTTATIRIKVIGGLSSAFRERLQDLDQRGVVEFTGVYSPSELPGLLAGVDAAALPSMIWDGANLAVEECQAARLPAVVPRLGGMPEAIRDGVDGLTFAGSDVDDLARQLDRLASEPGLLERMQAAIQAPRTFAEHAGEIESYYLGTHPEVALAPPEGPELEVRWQGDHGAVASLSIINDALTARLPFRIQRVTRTGDALDAPLSHGADVEIHHVWPPDLSAPPAGRFAAIVPWEFSAVPNDWLKPIIANVDELWVPSSFVRDGYLAGGVDAERVHVIPNGVDLELLHPNLDARDDRAPLRFLYVGGITYRKGYDVLIRAWDEAFAGRDDVVLVIKAAVSAGVYGELDQGLRARVESSQLPAIELLTDDLSAAALAELYRSADVFVLPYRAEGFAMPALEAMASGLPTILTAGGPTDEFCPPEAGWRIRASREPVDNSRLGNMATAGEPWMFVPDREHLICILQEAASVGRAELARRGAVARAAAEKFSWDQIADQYAARITALAASPTRRVDQISEAFPYAERVDLRVLATPAWRREDKLVDLLRVWSTATSVTTSACLYLLADPATAGTPQELERHILKVAADGGVSLEECADINLLREPFQASRDARLHLGVDVYVPLNRGCAGHERLARAYGSLVLDPDAAALTALLGAAAETSPVVGAQ